MSNAPLDKVLHQMKLQKMKYCCNTLYVEIEFTEHKEAAVILLITNKSNQT